MGLKPSKDRARSEAALYSTQLLRSPEQIRSLSQEAGRLFSGDADALTPEFFIASTDESAWAPRVVRVTRENSIVGIVYAKERKFAGIPIGIIYADATLHSMLAALPADRDAVLQAALGALMDNPGTRGLRVVVPETGYERDAILNVLAGRRMDVCYAKVENHSALELSPSYDAFLEKLGSTTRRNFRYYRRRFENEGHTYVEDIPLLEFRNVASALDTKCAPMSGRKGIERDLKILSTVSHPMFVGLRHKNGDWLSILGGWYETDRAVVFLQLNNDREYRQNSLSIVLRGYLIEGLMGRQVPRVLFWGGAMGTLQPYCQYLSAVCAHLNSPTFSWRVLRGLIGWSIDYLPEHLQRPARWVASKVSNEHDDAD